MIQRSTCVLSAIVALSSFVLPASAQFVRNTSSLPTAAVGSTENVDFGDVDSDGDWDAVFADGGDLGNQQNRLWINQGGAQGGQIGVFVDETAARMPLVLDTSRDIEFADIDGDGDLDLHTSNTSTVANQPNRWLVNMGGTQGGSPGFYQDQTAARWIAIGVNNGATFSSIPVSQVLATGGFLDWSCDSDFGDIDNDGDLDLVHSTYGPAFNANVPTRMFLNDGAGRFEEFNPSGFQLSSFAIVNGNPALWCEGVQTANTGNSTGAEADLATSALDIEFADVDGDLDLDLLHGARQELPRMFRNRLVENGGVLAPFRDVTGSSFVAGYATGNGHYEQEMGDLDLDGDVDIYGLNWLVTASQFNDTTLKNDGSGFFAFPQTPPGSQVDENEADYLDYDNDGDLDVLLANFSGQERLYRNDLVAGNFTLVNVTATLLPADTTNSLDADCCDVDDDGDTDAFVANGSNGAEWYLQNQTSADDTFAPYVAGLEQALDRVAGATPTVVRAAVLDNAPYYTTWYNPTSLEYSVSGGPFVSVPMLSSAGQLFRGEIPGSVVGSIQYRVRSSDLRGNTAVSTSKSYLASACSAAPVAYCTAKLNSLGCLPAISSTGAPSASATSGFVVRTNNVRNLQPGLLLYSITGQAATPFQGGWLCLAPPLRRTPVSSSNGSPTGADCSGQLSIDMNAFAAGLLGGNRSPTLTQPGTRVDCQFWSRDPGFPLPNDVGLSDALEYTICP